MMRKIAGIALAAWIALNLGMVVGAIGQAGSEYTIGWTHVFSLAFIMVATAVLAFFAGRNSK